MKSDPNCDISFKDCGKDTFYRLMNEMKYKYKHSNKVIRNEIIKTSRIRKLIKEFLIEKLRLE